MGGERVGRGGHPHRRAAAQLVPPVHQRFPRLIGGVVLGHQPELVEPLERVEGVAVGELFGGVAVPVVGEPVVDGEFAGGVPAVQRGERAADIHRRQLAVVADVDDLPAGRVDGLLQLVASAGVAHRRLVEHDDRAAA